MPGTKTQDPKTATTGAAVKTPTEDKGAPSAPPNTAGANISGKSETSEPQTAIDKWMTKNGFVECSALFKNAGYTDVEDITPEVVREILKDKPKGTIDRMVRLCTQKPGLEGKGEKLPPPKVDLGPRLEFTGPDAKGPTDIKMDIPNLGLATSTGSLDKVFSPWDLVQSSGNGESKDHASSYALWEAFARRSDMLRGLDLNGFYMTDQLLPAFTPVLQWEAPKDNNFFIGRELESSVTTDITYSAKASKLVACGFTKAAATFSCPYVSASFQLEAEEKLAKASFHSELYITSRYDLDRVSIDLKKCTVVSPKFVAEIMAALALGDPPAASSEGGKENQAPPNAASGSEERRLKVQQALATVFADYGQVVPRKVTLGGRLYFIHTKKADQTTSEESKQLMVGGGVKGSYGGFEGGGEFVRRSGKLESTNAEGMNENVAFRCRGGDARAVTEPGKWMASINDPRLWQVIRYEEVVPVLELLNESLRKQVLSFWDEPPLILPPKGATKTLDVGPKDMVHSVGVSFSENHRAVITNKDGWSAIGVADFEIRIAEADAGRYRLAATHSALEPRPLDVYCNGTTVKQDALAQVTGGWESQFQRRYDVGFVTLVPGVNRLRATRVGAFPHLASWHLTRESVTLTNQDRIDDPMSGAAIYQFEYPGQLPANHDIIVHYAAARRCPVRVTLNGFAVTEESLSSPTGGDTEDKETSMLIGTAGLKCGSNKLCIQPLSGKVLPTIFEIGFVR